MALDTAQHVETAPPERKKRKARWNMDATMRDAALVQMAMVVADKKSSHAAACKASAVLLRAEAQNQRDEQRRKKKVVKMNVPVLNLGWGENKVPESEVASKVAEFKRQWKETRRQEAEKARASGTRRKRARRWNIKPEYRDAMVLRWRMILADPEASQTVRVAVVSLMVRAEAQNQKDEEYRKKNKNRSQEPLIVEFTQDFYGNNAHELAAARAAAEASANPAAEASAGSVVAEMKEDRDLRPTVTPLKGTTLFARAGTNEKHDLRPEVKPDAGKASGLGPQSWYATGPPPARR